MVLNSCLRTTRVLPVNILAALSDISSNILFFCCLCLQKLPSALSAYDNVDMACSSMEKSIKSVEISLSNRFGSLTDQVSGLSSISFQN